MYTKNVILWLKNAQQNCIVVVSLGCNPNMYHKCVSVVHFELQIQVSIRGIFGFPNMWGGNRKANEGKVNSIHDTSIGNYFTPSIFCLVHLQSFYYLPFALLPLSHHLFLGPPPLTPSFLRVRVATPSPPRSAYPYFLCERRHQRKSLSEMCKHEC